MVNSGCPFFFLLNCLFILCLNLNPIIISIFIHETKQIKYCKQAVNNYSKNFAHNILAWDPYFFF